MDATLTPERILALLDEPAPPGEETLDLHDRLHRDASTSNLVGALRAATDLFDRQMLLDLLGFRHAKAAIPDLLAYLSDPEPKVRGAAADALGKAFGYVRVPPPPSRREHALAVLRERWAVEDSDAVRSTLAQTLALLGDPSVRPLLEAVLDHPDRRVRRQAEWGLRYLDRKAAGA